MSPITTEPKKIRKVPRNLNGRGQSLAGHPGYVFTSKGIRRIAFKLPSKNFSRRTLVRNERRLAFCKAHNIPALIPTAN